jgi:phage gpG-like protein
MTKPTVTVDATQAQVKLAKVLAATQSPAMYDAIGSAVTTLVRLGFSVGRDPWGKPWAPIKWRAPRRTNDGARLSKTGREQVTANRGGNAGQPLVDTGRLRRSITHKSDATGVTIGTNIKAKSGASIAAVHQFGATIKPKNGKRLVFPGPGGGLVFAKRVVIPQRAFLPLPAPGAAVTLPDAWTKSIVRRLRGYLKREVAA